MIKRTSRKKDEVLWRGPRARKKKIPERCRIAKKKKGGESQSSDGF